MSKITVIGAGYVGLVTAACFANMGNEITLVEIDKHKIKLLEKGILPVHEESLPDLWQRNWALGRLNLTDSYSEGLKNSEFAFIAVGTPSSKNGKPDLKWIKLAAKSISEANPDPLIIVLKSTVPVGTADIVSQIINQNNHREFQFPIVSNPEFLREGLAVYDFIHPTRIVIGSNDKVAINSVANLYQTIDSPRFTTDNRTAELCKYASNAFLATRISFMNEVSLLCDELGVDVAHVSQIVGLEPKCGSGYLSAGLGWGGSCLPKDVKGLLYMARVNGIPSPVISAVQQVNQRQINVPVKKLVRLLGSLEGKTIGILGLAFKPNSNDMREASSLKLITLLEKQGCLIKAYDPVAIPEASKLMPQITYSSSAYDVAEGSDSLILVTEWDEFKNLDLKRLGSVMRRPIFVDGRNFFNPDDMIEAGFIYEGIGRRRLVTRKPMAIPV